MAEDADDEPSMREYLTGVFWKMFQTGVLKCIMPVLFIFMAQWAPSDGAAQEIVAQIAGGLLLYTWAFGCLAPIHQKIDELVLPGSGYKVEAAAGGIDRSKCQHRLRNNGVPDGERGPKHEKVWYL